MPRFAVFRYRYRGMRRPSWDAVQCPRGICWDDVALPPTILAPGVVEVLAPAKSQAISRVRREYEGERPVRAADRDE